MLLLKGSKLVWSGRTKIRGWELGRLKCWELKRDSLLIMSELAMKSGFGFAAVTDEISLALSSARASQNAL